MDALAHVEGEVRELVRRSGVDPSRDGPAVRRLVEDVTHDYEQRCLSSALPVVTDRSELIDRVWNAVAGFGPLQRYLDDPEVEEIWINEPGKVFIARHGIAELTTTILTDTTVADLVERMLAASGRRVDLSSPFVDATLPDGSRLHVVIPDVTRQHWAVNIRKFVVRARHLDDLVQLGTLTAQAAAFLAASVRAGLNILVAGATQAGKTTLVNCLAGAIDSRERIVTCEEVFELHIDGRDVVALQCRPASLEGTGEISLRRLVKESLRMRPSRIIVGEVRQAESLDMLLALNSGLPGMCTVHANSARDALTKLCTLPLLAGENVSSSFVTPTVAASIDLVIHMALGPTGHRQVREVVAVPGRVEGGVIETADVFSSTAGVLERGGGFPPHVERFERLGIDVAELLRPGADRAARSAVELIRA